MPGDMMRFTIIDRDGGVSFIASSAASLAMVAACGQNPQSIERFLEALQPFYADLREYVLNGLATFDEANAPGSYAPIHAGLRRFPPLDQPVFRVVDEITREASLQPIEAGAILFNLPAKRIIQLANSSRELKRAGRGRIFDGMRLTNQVFTYRLPADWSLVP